MNRKQRLLLNGIPRYIRCYDNGGETIDRYTAVFTGNYRKKTGGEFWHLCMSANPYHPQGMGQHGGSNDQIDKPTYSHLGKKINFTDLPADCQKLVLHDYIYLWDL